MQTLKTSYRFFKKYQEAFALGGYSLGAFLSAIPIGIFMVVVGIGLTGTIVLAIIGIPLMIAGVIVPFASAIFVPGRVKAKLEAKGKWLK